MKTLIALALTIAVPAFAQRGITMHAKGSFDVKVVPLPESGGIPQRMSLEKQYHGALEASATGEMLAGGNQKAGSAGYVALETVSGTLDGHAGSFGIMQFGTILAGKPEMKIEIVPGSGVGALAGILGTMTIDFGPSGEHFYTLEYSLPK
jgi:hypothetical protein